MTAPTPTPAASRPTARPPLGLAGMLVLVALVEVAIGACRADLAPPWAEDWRFARWAAEHRAPGADVLCFGDSLVKYGVLPRAIEAGAGLKAYNLATSGGTMPSAFFLLQRALDAGARPRAVVVDVAALMLADAGAAGQHNYPELATVADCAGLARARGDADLLAALLLAKALPSVAWRFELRGLVVASLAGRSGSQRAAGTEHRRRWETHRGAQPMPLGRARHPREDYLVDGVSPADWAIDPTDGLYLDRFLALAASQGVPVAWLIPPLGPEVHARRAMRGSDAAYDRFVRDRLARFPGVVVLDARRSGYDDSVHVDHIHLDRDGARILSADIADALAARPGAADRWVDLPPLGGRAALASRGATVR